MSKNQTGVTRDPYGMQDPSITDHIYSDQYPDAWESHDLAIFDRAIQAAKRRIAQYQIQDDLVHATLAGKILLFLEERRSDYARPEIIEPR